MLNWKNASTLATAAVAALIGASSGAQSVQWSAKLHSADVRAGEGAQIVLTATVPPKWHLYSFHPMAPGPFGSPLKTTAILAEGALTAAGAIVQPTPKKLQDKGFQISVDVFEGKVAFGVPVKIKSGASGKQTGKLSIRYMICNDRTCMPPATSEVEFSFKVAKGAARPAKATPPKTVPKVAAL